MEKGLLPEEHLHMLLDSEIPQMRWDGKEDLSAWQKNAREKLSKLIGLNEIAKYAVKPEIEIEFDKYSEDLDCREIRFRIKTEENVTVPCHLCIPKDAKGPLPVVICLQGHARGMHISLARPKFPGEDALCKNGDRDFVARALKEGVCGIAVEQRCFGENGGHPEHSAPQCRQAAMRAIIRVFLIADINEPEPCMFPVKRLEYNSVEKPVQLPKTLLSVNENTAINTIGA